MSTGTVRRLTVEDAEEILRMDAFSGLSPARLIAEMTAENDYFWMGLTTAKGRLYAVHRSMRWGRHLLLKGVFVEETERGSSAALRLAFTLRDAARARGFDGIAAWIEPQKAEAALAHMLRLRPTGPLVHRYEVPVADGADGAGAEEDPRALCDGARPAANTGTVGPDPQWPASAAPAFNDLFDLDDPSARSGTGRLRGGRETHWVVDGRRLVLSACPSPATTELPLLAAAMSPLAKSQGVEALEVPVQAADLVAALSLANTGTRRLSRTPVRLGRLDFPPRAASPAAANRRVRPKDQASA